MFHFCRKLLRIPFLLFYGIGYTFNGRCSPPNSWQRVRALPKIGFSPFGKQTNPFLQVINDAFSQHSMKYYFVCKLLLFLSHNWLLQHSCCSKINTYICSKRILMHHQGLYHVLELKNQFNICSLVSLLTDPKVSNIKIKTSKQEFFESLGRVCSCQQHHFSIANV